jgi:pimeloyl-ACP methyl ester carboxylesterase
VVFFHGGAQNAHTWDTVCLALGGSMLALDLPGHGHSDGGAGDPVSNAADLIPAVHAHASAASTLVGMSLGGLSALALAARERHVFSRLILVDITPGVNQEKAGHITAFVNGPATFESFDELLARTIEHNPTRSVSSLRRGILHNAVQLDDGTWQWRYARHRNPMAPRPLEHGSRWDDLSALEMPVLLVRGMARGSVVDDDDEAKFLSVTKRGSVVRVSNAGHSVQGDTPVELAAIISEFIGS